MMAASWGPISNSGELQNNYSRIPFDGAPHIIGSAYLAEVSTGELSGTAGVALAAFKRFEFLDGNGVLQETEITDAASFVEVERCVSITVALDIRAATALGGWSFYWME
jgi:hypothetical protein